VVPAGQRRSGPAVLCVTEHRGFARRRQSGLLPPREDGLPPLMILVCMTRVMCTTGEKVGFFHVHCDPRSARSQTLRGGVVGYVANTVVVVRDDDALKPTSVVIGLYPGHHSACDETPESALKLFCPYLLTKLNYIMHCNVVLNAY
jgi:hypothetical protein